MALPLFKERRYTERRKLTGLLPGRLSFSASGADLVCKPVDISTNGLGVIAARELEPGTRLVLQVEEGEYPLIVAWCQPDFGKQDCFRYGLVLEEPVVNLEALFLAKGCMR